MRVKTSIVTIDAYRARYRVSASSRGVVLPILGFSRGWGGTPQRLST